MKKSIKQDSANTSRLQENMLLICLSYGFTGANFIISSIVEINSNNVDCKISIMLGIIMLCMVPISYFDKRKEMRGKLNVIMCCIMHFALSMGISYTYLSWWIMILYIVEVMISISIVLIKRIRYQKSNPKQTR